MAKTFRFKSKSEERINNQLNMVGIKGEELYEILSLPFTQPIKKRKYIPDFVLPNGIIIEVKGEFKRADRQKHLDVKNDYPDLDIRFVFDNSRNKINKGSKTTYADWCLNNDFQYADKYIPEEWLNEPPKETNTNTADIKATQNKHILEYLQQGHELSQIEAKELFNTLSLNWHIWSLRKQGYEILTRIKEKNGLKYAVYRLKQ